MDIDDFILKPVSSVSEADQKAEQAYNLVRDAKNRGDIELSEYYPLAGKIRDQLRLDYDSVRTPASPTTKSVARSKPSAMDLLDDYSKNIAQTPADSGKRSLNEALEDGSVFDVAGEAIMRATDPNESVVLDREKVAQRTLGDRGQAIGTATGLGAGIGLALPGALTGLGKFVKNLPGGNIVGAGLSVAGNYLGKVPKTISAVEGGIGAGLGETTGQVVAEATGRPALGFAADLIVGTGVGAASSILEATWGVTGRIARKLNSVSISQESDKHIVKAIDNLNLGNDDYIPTITVAKALENEGKKIADSGYTAALKSQRAKYKEISTLGDEVSGLSKRIEVSALEGEKLFTSVGTPRQLSDTGEIIRNTIHPKFTAKLEARAGQYTKDLDTRNSVVAKKEANGDYVTNQPVYKKLMKEIENKLLMGVKALNTPTKQVADPGVVNAYKSIYSALNDKIVPISEAQYKRLAKKGLKVEERNSPDGPVYFRIFPNSFEALDDVRRKLGDAAFNKSEEGYGALGQNIAKDLYSKVSAIQLKYAGESHRILQGNYEEASSLLVPFKAMRGNKVTAVDKIDPSQFKDDVAGLPAKFFSTRQGAMDLIELTADRGVAEDLARGYVTKLIQAMDGKQLNTFITDKRTSDWVRVFPKLKTDLDTLLVNTRKNEALMEGLTIKSKRLSDAKLNLTKGTMEEGDKIVNEALTFASEVAGDVYRPEARIAKLLSSTKDPKVLSTVTKVIMSSPETKAAFPLAVRQYIARNANKNVKSLWMGNLKPMLKASGMVDDASLASIERDVLNVQSAFNDSESGVHLLNKVIFTTLTTGLATAPTRQKEAKTYFTDRGKPASIFSL